MDVPYAEGDRFLRPERGERRLRFTVSLTENRVFQRLSNKGKRAVQSSAALYYRRTGRPVTRLGLTVGTKLGSAVVRNRVKRRLREIYRLEEPKLKPGYDLVIVARVRARDADYHTLERELKRLFDMGGLYRESGGR